MIVRDGLPTLVAGCDQFLPDLRRQRLDRDLDVDDVLRAQAGHRRRADMVDPQRQSTQDLLERLPNSLEILGPQRVVVVDDDGHDEITADEFGWRDGLTLILMYGSDDAETCVSLCVHTVADREDHNQIVGGTLPYVLYLVAFKKSMVAEGHSRGNDAICVSDHCGVGPSLPGHERYCHFRFFDPHSPHAIDGLQADAALIRRKLGE